MSLTILYEDNHLIAVDKPSGVLTQGDRTGRESLMDQVKEYLKAKYRKPGRVFLGMVHRLDRQVSGIVVFARTSKAASRLSGDIREGRIIKLYLALVENTVVTAGNDILRGSQWRTLTHFLVRTKGITIISEKTAHDSKESVLKYLPLASSDTHTLLLIELLTGRKHQIRAQLSGIGIPVAGDTLYRAKEILDRDRIGLHAVRTVFRHPTQAIPVDLVSSPPSHLFSSFKNASELRKSVMEQVRQDTIAGLSTDRFFSA